jgi:hypothetical protein
VVLIRLLARRRLMSRGPAEMTCLICASPAVLCLMH